MSDILADARQWLDTHGRLENIGTHGEECHRWHLPCLVTRLAAEIARLREERRWVPVGERLPEKYQIVIVALTPDSKGRVEVCEAVHWKGSDFETDRGNYECSHWMTMPLPPGPEGDV